VGEVGQEEEERRGGEEERRRKRRRGEATGKDECLRVARDFTYVNKIGAVVHPKLEHVRLNLNVKDAKSQRREHRQRQRRHQRRMRRAELREARERALQSELHKAHVYLTR